MVEKVLQIGLNSELQRIFLELVRITHILSLDLKVLGLGRSLYLLDLIVECLSCPANQIRIGSYPDPGLKTSVVLNSNGQEQREAL